MIRSLKYYHDNLNIVVILALGRDFFSAKSAKFLLIFTKYKVFPPELLSFIFEINLLKK